MKFFLAQNTPMTGDGMATNGNGMMENGAMNASMAERNRPRALMGLGEMVAAPNLAFTPEQFGANQATLMRASGGPIPGLREAKAGQVSDESVTNDVAILSSALLLEYLESEFYARVVAADGTRPYLTGRTKVAAQTLARDEATHVQTVSDLIRKLGGAPIEKPQFQFPANVFFSPIAFLQVSVELEENGVGAYLGAAPLVKNKDVLNFAASIYGTETRHTAWVRFLLGETLAPRNLEQPRTIEEATANAAPFIVKDIVAPMGQS